ncbi:MAG: AAA family ATPase [Anaerolineae bacterium]|nr:AAA family ATPase [Anaerolineae bacterium]
MNATIVLIGPMSVGKSTIAQLLAERLGIERVSLDDLRWDYYDEIGYDREKGSRIVDNEGIGALLKYWKPFEVYAVERVVSDHDNCVIDFGASHSVFEDPALFARVQNALAPIEHVILLLPSPDLDESVAILNARFSPMTEGDFGEVDPDLLAMNEHFVKHPSNHRLATMTVYTKGHSAEETCDEIVKRIKETE